MKEQEGHEEFRNHTMSLKKQKMETKERMSGKMLEFTT